MMAFTWETFPTNVSAWSNVLGGTSSGGGSRVAEICWMLFGGALVNDLRTLIVSVWTHP